MKPGKKEKSPQEIKPSLGHIKRDQKAWTYSENRILDQITTEIMEAWAKDLRNIKECHQEILDSYKEFKRITCLMEQKFPDFQEFIESNSYIMAIPHLEESTTRVEALLEKISQLPLEKPFNLISKINYDSEVIKKHVESIDLKMKYLMDYREDMPKNNRQASFWKKLFCSMTRKNT